MKIPAFESNLFQKETFQKKEFSFVLIRKRHCKASPIQLIHPKIVFTTKCQQQTSNKVVEH